MTFGCWCSSVPQNYVLVVVQWLQTRSLSRVVEISVQSLVRRTQHIPRMTEEKTHHCGGLVVKTDVAVMTAYNLRLTVCSLEAFFAKMFAILWGHRCWILTQNCRNCENFPVGICFQTCCDWYITQEIDWECALCGPGAILPIPSLPHFLLVCMHFSDLM